MGVEIGLLTIYFFMIAWNVIYGITSYKNPQVLKAGNLSCSLGNVIAVALLALLVFITVNDHDNPDYYGYLLSYGNSNFVPATSIGYEYLMKWGGVLYFDYDLFRVIVYAVCYTLVWISLSRLGINKNIALGLYAVFPFTYDAIQFRFFISFTIVLFVIPYLSDKRKSGLIKYIMGITVAGLFHTVSFIYITFVLIRINGKERIRQRLLMLIFVLSTALMVYSLFVPNSAFRTLLVDIFVANADEVKIRNYNVGFSWKATILLILQELMFLLTAYINKKIADRQPDNKIRELSNLIYGCNLVISCTLPLLLVTPNFLRLYRNLTIVNYGIPGILAASERKDQRIVICGVLFVISFIFITWWNFYLGDSLEDVFWTLFNGV